MGMVIVPLNVGITVPWVEWVDAVRWMRVMGLVMKGLELVGDIEEEGWPRGCVCMHAMS
jgi:hypothetical protein